MIDVRNQADALVYQTEKQLKEYKDKIDAADVSRLEGDLESVRVALKGTNTADIKSATERLNATWQEVAQKMYQQASATQAGAAGAGAEAGGGEPSSDAQGPDGVADAEYEVLDDDKNA